MDQFTSGDFKTSLGTGYFWTDNEFVRVVIRANQSNSQYAFRIHAEDMPGFIKQMMVTYAAALMNAGMEEELEAYKAALDSAERKVKAETH